MTSADRFLVAAADLFVETGEWPVKEEVQDLLVYRRDPTDAEREAKRLSASRGRYEGDRICPSVQGIHAADPSHPALEYFERVLIFGARKYRRRKRRARTVVSRGEAIEVLGLTSEEADRALALLVSESLAVEDPDGNDAVVIAPSIRHYFEVRSAREYVKVKRKLECRLFRMDKVRQRVRELARKAGGAAGRIVLAALAIVLATFLIWLATQIFGGDHDKPDQRHSLRSAAARSGG